MQHIMKKIANITGRILKWFFVFVVFWFIFLTPAVIYDLAHHGRLPEGALLERMITIEKFLSGIGMDYCLASNILSDGFATLFTAMSLVFTICTSLMNRSADKIYGVSRSKLVFNGKEHLYKGFSRVVYGAPFLMMFMVNLDYTMAGYVILLIVYVYLLLCYGIYGWTFEEKANEERMARFLSGIFPQDLRNKNELSWYRKTLGGVGASARNDNDWQGIKELVYRLLQEELDYERKFVQVYAVYSDIFPGSASVVLLEVMFGGLKLFRRWCLQDNDRNSRKHQNLKKQQIEVKEYQISVWAMFCGAFHRLKDAEIVQFLEVLLDFRGQIEEVGKEANNRYVDFSFGYMKIEAGMAMILLECRLHSANRVSDGVQKFLTRVWSQGKYLLADENRLLLCEMTKYYKKWSALPDGQWDIYLNNLRRDYEENSTYSMIRSLSD